MAVNKIFYLLTVRGSLVKYSTILSRSREFCDLINRHGVLDFTLNLTLPPLTILNYSLFCFVVTKSHSLSAVHKTCTWST
jgi:hypothetical protein